MLLKRMMLAGLFAILGMQGALKADPFPARRVPADAKWVLHADMDAIRPSKAWGIFSQKLETNDDFKSKVDGVEQLTGMRFPDDLHDVTLYGRALGEEAGIVIIHAQFDKDKVLAALQGNPAYASQKFGDYEVHTWDDNGKKNFGAFYGKDIVVIARSEENVESALSTLDGKAESVKPESPLAGGSPSQLLVYVAARDLASLKKDDQPLSPIVKQIDHAWLGLSEKAENAVLHGTISAQSNELAQQIVASLNGIKAMVSLAATGNNADANTKAAASALATMTATQQDKTVSVDWPVSLDVVRGILDRAPKPATAGAN